MNSFRVKGQAVLQWGMVQLSLSFLGTFQVKLGDKPITKFRSANVQGLLVYLALHPGRALSRDVLAALFWPEEPDSTARTNFRQTLYQLRKLLELGEDKERPFLIVTRQTVQFNLNSDAFCDVTAFLQALKLGELATAVSLYPDDLLPGFTCDSLEFEAWLRRERERLHGLALDALQRRADWLLGSGNLAEAKALAQRQLALEPWRELAHRQLMQAYALGGDRQAALAQFESCQVVLWDELAVKPELETAELAQKIAAGVTLTLDTHPQHNLIAPVTPYFGRENDLAAVRARITDQDYRLVTLVGEGGIGKSRLALEVAWQLREQFADGAWFVPLAGLKVSEPAEGLINGYVAGSNLPQVKGLQEAIATAVLQTLDQPLAGQQTAKAQLTNFLRRRNLLLVLDNFEPLLDGAGLVLDLLQQAGGVCVICTSREPLNFQAEWVLPLERLPLPPIADPFLNTTAVPQDPTNFPAVQLFADRAQRANGRFQLTGQNMGDVVTLCRLLVGLPLALELAAAALRNQSLPQIIAALQHSLDALAAQRRDIPSRHRSMRAVFDSSWALLTPAEQAQLASLSVFLGPFSEQSAEAVTEATRYELQMLVGKSLLHKQGDRFVLHALLRQFTAEKLAGFPENEAVERHSRYYLQAVADLGGALNGEMPHLAVQRIGAAWGNVKGAWETAVTHQDFPHLLPAIVSLSDFCQIRGLYREGLRLFGKAADSVSAAAQPELLAQLLTQQAALQVRLSNYPKAIDLCQQALSLTTDAWVVARLHITTGEAYWRQGELEAGREQLRKAHQIARKNQINSLLGIATYHLGIVHDLAGSHKESLAFLEEALVIWRELGNLRQQGFTLNSIGFVSQRLSLWDKARETLAIALRISQGNQDHQGQIMTLNNLATLATEDNDFSGSRQLLLRALDLAQNVGARGSFALLQSNLAWNAKRAGLNDEANRHAEIALKLRRKDGDKRGEAKVLRLLGDIAREKELFVKGEDLYKAAASLSLQAGDQFNVEQVNKALHQLKIDQHKKNQE